MRVAILMPLAEQRGGGEKRFWNLMLESLEANIEWVIIFQENGPMVDQVRSLGITVHVVPVGRLRELHRFVASILKIASIAKRERVHTIFSWMWKSHLYGCPAAMLAGIPSLWFQLENPQGHGLKGLATRLPTSGIFINSLAGKAYLEDLRPNKPIHLVYPGVALNHFDPSIIPSKQEIRQKLGLPLDVPIIGIVGRLQRWKGIHVLIEAMPTVLQQYPNCLCIIIGGKHDLEPEYEAYLKENIQLHGLSSHVLLMGLQHNIPEWMHALDIFIHASDHEPFGAVIVEAMAMGKPIVAAASGGPLEILTHEVDGLLTPFGDSNALANAILRYLNDPYFAKQVSDHALRRAPDFSTKLSAENFVHGIYEIIPQ